MATNPITLAEAKLYLRSSAGDLEDGLLQIMLDAAFEYITERTGQTFGEVEYVETYDGGIHRIRLRHAGASEISEVMDNRSGSALNVGAYTLDGNYLYFTGAAGFEPTSWPRGEGRYTLTYTAGWPEAAYPATLRHAILYVVEKMYNTRGGAVSQSAAGASAVRTSLANDSNLDAMLDAYDDAEVF